MYEHFRNDVMARLIPHFNTDDLIKISAVIDHVADNYKVSEKETALVLYDDEAHKTVNLYLASKKLEGLSELTIKCYAYRLRTFFDTIHIHLRDIKANDIRMFLVTYQQQNKISDRTLDKFREIINGFFQWCVNEEYLIKNPCRNINPIKYEVEPRHSLTRMELEKIRRACSCSRDLAIIDVLYSTGCRVAELVNMKMSDINYEDYSVRIIGKGKKHNTVYLNINAQLSLADYFNKDRRGKSEYIFVSNRKPYNQLSIRSVQHILGIIGDKLNIKLTPHTIRHTSATLAIQQGMPIEQVQKMLGHSSVATTQIYAEVFNEDVAVSHKKHVV